MAALLRRSTALNAVLAHRMGLSVTDLGALHQLVGRPPLGTVELARHLGMSSAAATVLVDRLERAGYVQRRRDEKDRRRVILEVTSETEERSRAAVAGWISAVVEIENGMTEEQLATVEGYLEQVLTEMTRFIENSAVCAQV